SLETVSSVLAGRGIAVPFGYVVARTFDGQSVVGAGTDFDSVHKLDSWGSVSNWPSGATDDIAQALVGIRAAAVVSPRSQPFELSFQGRAIRLTPAGTLHTGAAEDSCIYLGQRDFETWTGIHPSTIEIAVSGSPEEINATVQKLAQALPAADVR